MKFFNTTKYRISMLVVMVMLLQVLIPAVGEFVWAEEDDSLFKVKVGEIEKGKTTIDWEFTLDPDNKVGIKPIELGFTLKEAVEDETLVANGESKTEIGTYNISKDGIMTVEIHDSLYNTGNKDDGQENVEESDTDSEVDGIEDLEVPEGETEDFDNQEANEEVESEETTGDENEDVVGEELGVAASLSDNLRDILADSNEQKTIFTGTIKVDGVKTELYDNEEDPVKLDKVILTFTDEDGNKLDAPYPPDAKVEMEIKFTIEDYQEVEVGKLYTMQLPEEIKMLKEWNLDLTLIDPETEESVKVADAHITTDGFITITFLEEINEYDEDRFVWVKATGQLNEEKLGEDGEKEIKFEFQSETITVPIEIETFELEEGITLKKTGSQYNNDTHKITWTITVIPTTNAKDGKIKDVVITDTLPEGQIYVSSTPNGKYAEEEHKLIFNLGEVENGKLKTIEIVTKSDVNVFKDAEEDTDITFVNKASGTFGEDNKNIPEVTASVSTTVNYIEKNGEFIAGDTRADDRIKWIIELNNNNLNLERPLILEDEIPEGLVLDGSIEIVPSEGVNYSLTDGGFPITFPNGLKKKVTITYYTNIVDSNAYNPNIESKYPNTAILKGAGNDRKSTKIEGIGKTIISKKGNGYNASDHTVSWEIIVNGSRMDITNPVVTDTLDSRLEYVKHTITPEPEKWEFTDDNGTLTFTYKGNGGEDVTIDKSYTINITTKIKDGYKDLYGANTNTIFNNSAVINGDNLPENGISTGNKIQDYSSTVIKKTNEGYDYTERKAKWKIVVNQNNMQIDNAMVTDIIGDNHELVEGTLKIDGNPITKGGNSTPYYTHENKILKIHLGNIKKQKNITFETKIPTEKIDDFFGEKNETVSLTNKATIEGSTIKNGGESSISTKNIENTIVGKKAKYTKGNDFIDWEVIINSNRINLGNIILEDELNDKLELDISTVKLYKLTYGSNGEYTIGATEEPIETKYTPEDKNKVEFLIDNVTEAYILKFTTDIKGDSDRSTIFNTINLKGSGDKSYGSKTSVSISFDNASGGASGSKTRGSITIIKSGEEKGLLPGIEFELLDSNQKSFSPEVIKKETDEDGTIVFDDLRMGTYYLKEVSPLKGYNPIENVKVELKKGLDTKHQTVKKENKLIRGNIEFIKYGKDLSGSEILLPGAEFMLFKAPYKEFDEPFKTATSDENGLVSFKSIPYGEYIIKENTAPIGYAPSDLILEAKITEEGETVQPISKGEVITKIFNQRIIGDLEIIKKSKSGETLEGAEFELRNNDDEDKVYTGTTDKNGRIVFNGIDYGTYTLKETKAPRGHILNEETYEVKILEYNQDIIRIPVVNEKIKGSLEILKIDKKTNRPLKNAIFILYDRNMKKVAEAITDKDGKAVFENLVFGQYFYEETKAPNGYYRDKTIYGLNIPENEDETLENGFVIEKILENTKIPPTDPYDPDPYEPEEPKPEEPKPEDPKPEEPKPEDPKPNKPIIINPPPYGTVEFDEDGNWIYIPDPDAPKGKITFTIKHPDGREELIEIDLDKVPLDTTQITEKDIKLPKTGEDNYIFFYFTGLALIILGFVFRRKRA